MTQKNVKNLALNVVFASFKGRKKSNLKQVAVKILLQ